MPIRPPMNKRKVSTRLVLARAAVALLALAGLVFVGRGLLGSTEDGVQQATVSPTVSPVAIAPAMGVRVFRADAPSERRKTEDVAVCPACDVVLISVCSLRKDHVGAYRGMDISTPNMDALAQAGTRFESAYAASSFTLAGLTSVLTGRFGSTTGVTGWDKGLTQDVLTLPEVLGYYGYSTAAFTTDAPSGFRPDYGLNRGFQYMEIRPPPPGTPDGRNLPGALAAPGEVARPMADWIQGHSGSQPLFAMLHTRSAHFPFVIEAPEEAADPTGMSLALWRAGMDQRLEQNDGVMPGMDGGTGQKGIVKLVGADPLQSLVSREGQPAVDVWRRHYREAVERMDADVGRVVDALKSSGRWDRTVVILLADHGESLNEHDELLHGDAFFQGVVNVPFIVRVPGLDGPEAHDALVSHVDVLPTLLSVVGATEPAGIDGLSILPLLQGQTAPIRQFALAEGGVAKHDSDSLPGAVIAPPWILLKQKRGCGATSSVAEREGFPICLFNLETDPEQRQSVASQYPQVVDALLERWTVFRAERAGGKGSRIELSTEFVEALRRDGYDFSKDRPQ